MTVIAAYEDSEGYWIGSDSMGVGAGLQSELGTKIIKKGNCYVAFTVSYRVADVIRESKNLPMEVNSITDFRKFRDILTEELVEKAGARTEAHNGNGVKEGPVGLILISSSGIYVMEADYQIHKIKSGYYANGSGWAIANGALYAAQQQGLGGKEAVTYAVKAAIFHSATCGGRCYIKFVRRA